MKAFAFFNIFIFSVLFMLTPGPAQAQAQSSEVRLTIERYTSTGSEVNVLPELKDLQNFEGYRLVALEVSAGALNESSTVILSILDSQQGPSLQLGQTISNSLIYLETEFPLDQVIGKIRLRTEMPAHIKTVTLFLTR